MRVIKLIYFKIPNHPEIKTRHILTGIFEAGPIHHVSKFMTSFFVVNIIDS